MSINYGPCQVKECKNPRPYLSKPYCYMHLARLSRNGTLFTQREMGINYNQKLGSLDEEQLEYITNNAQTMIDREMSAHLNVPLHLVRYARRKLIGRKYKSLNKRTYLKLKFRKLKNNTCEICGWNEAPCDIHHKIPLSKGGADAFDNWICVCPNHHRILHFNELTNRKINDRGSAWISSAYRHSLLRRMDKHRYDLRLRMG